MKSFSRLLLSFYLIFYCLPFPIGSLPGTDWLEEKYLDSTKWLAAWIGNHAIGMGPVFVGPTGSGDTPVRYILVGWFVFLALCSSLLWTIFLRRRHDGKLHLWVYQYVRLTLASALFVYGWAKMIPPGQFGMPSAARLIEPIGEASPMGLLWTFMGSSRAYTFFAGLMEVLAGIFLFVPRLTTAGALLSAGVMTNVFVLNMCYDVPVKLYSFHLLVFSLFLLTPDLKRILRFFVLNRPTDAKVFPPLFEKRGMEKMFFIVQTIFAFVVTFTVIQSTLTNAVEYQAMTRKIKFFGVWKVKAFSSANAESSENRWTRVAFDFRDRIYVRTADGEWLRFQADYDSTKPQITLHGMDEFSSSGDMTFEQPTPSQLTLKGLIDSKIISMQLQKEDEIKFPLLNRGFRWTSELPFNR